MKAPCLAFGLLLAAAALSSGQEIRVTKSAVAKSGIDLSAFRCSASGAAGLFRRTLETDLVRSGWFAVTGPGAGTYAVSGSVDEQRPSLQVRCQAVNAVSRESLLNKSYSGDAGRPSQLAHRVADDIVAALTGRPGIASSRLACIGAVGRGKELFICDANGESVAQLTHDGSISIAPAWSPSGSELAYTSFRSGFPDAYAVDLRTGRRRPVSSHSGMNSVGDISPDGKDLILTLSKDGNPDLYILSLQSGGLTRLTATPHAGEASPSWSPDGSRIVYVSDLSGTPQLYITSRSSGDRKRLTSRGSENVEPDWGPSGLIAYASKRDGRYQICVLDPQTMEDHQITADHANHNDPSWAPDGRHIACSRNAAGRCGIYVLDTMGDDPIPLLPLSGNWSSPAWSIK